MSITFINRTSRVAIAGRVAERRRQPQNWNEIDDARRLPPALRQGRSPGRSREVALSGLITNAERRVGESPGRCGRGQMFTIPELAAEALGSHLAEQMGRRFGSTDAGLIERVQSAARLAIDCIGNSDALYHNVEHTMLVTLVGLDILKGRQLLIETSASDFEHLIVACLCHDIGYVRGILSGDSADGYIIDAKGNKADTAARLVRRRAHAVPR